MQHQHYASEVQDVSSLECGELTGAVPVQKRTVRAVKISHKDLASNKNDFGMMS